MSDFEEAGLVNSNEMTTPFGEEERGELIDSLRQMLEDIRVNETKHSLMEQLREEYGLLVEKYKDDINTEIQLYIRENRKEEDSAEEDLSQPSLDTIYILSEELTSIVGKTECSGREILYHVWKYIHDHALYDPSNPSSLILDEVFSTPIQRSFPFMTLQYPCFGYIGILNQHNCINNHIFLPEVSQDTHQRKATGFNKPIRLAKELAEFVGAEEMARPQIVKVFWKYFKDHNLQDPSNKRMIICDDTLKLLLGEEQIQSFGLMKYLKKYFVQSD